MPIVSSPHRRRPRHIRVQDNARTLNFDDRARYAQQDVFRFLRRQYIGERFDIIFAAPPYRIAEPQQILTSLAAAQIDRTAKTEAGGLATMDENLEIQIVNVTTRATWADV